jgi:N utilization substance protein A
VGLPAFFLVNNMAKQKIKVIREEMLQVANNVAQEKSIDQDSVFEAMEMALEKAARVKYGFERDIRVSINRDSGDIKLNSYLEVVEKLSEEEQAKQITLDEAKKIQPNITTGEFIIKELPPIDMGRVAAQNAKGVIIQKVREADKSRQFSEYKDKVGEIAVGVVKRTEFGNLIVDLGKNEAIIKREELIPRETFQNGDRVRAYIYDVKEDIKGYQIFLSRTHPQFLSNLFTQEVPEIYENVIQIKSVARDPGSRAKISVYTEDSTIDPVGACVGMRGSRVQAVVNELQGEKIDIVMWSDNQATFLANALAPAEVSKIFLYEEKNKVEVVIPDEQLSLAIGRKGQNVKLASNLTNLEIDILTEEQESERRQEEFKEKTQMLINNLDVEDVIAQLLVTEGYVSVEGIASESLENLEKIEGFDKNLASELISRASNHLSEKNAEDVKIIDEKIHDNELKKLDGMNNKMLSLLAQNNIVTIDDFADLASFELIDKEEGIFKDLDIDENVVNNMIMKAREKWFTEVPVEEVVKAEDVKPAAAEAPTEDK